MDKIKNLDLRNWVSNTPINGGLVEGFEGYWKWRKQFKEGPPKATLKYSVIELEDMRMIGLYRTKDEKLTDAEIKSLRRASTCEKWYDEMEKIIIARNGNYPKDWEKIMETFPGTLNRYKKGFFAFQCERTIK